MQGTTGPIYEKLHIKVNLETSGVVLIASGSANYGKNRRISQTQMQSKWPRMSSNLLINRSAWGLQAQSWDISY